MIATLLFACQQQAQITETGNPERNLAVTVVALDVGPTVDSAWASFGETEFELEDRYVEEHELEWQIPGFAADLSAGPQPLPFVSPSLSYDHVEIRPRHPPSRPEGAPDAFERASLVLDGTRSDAVPFRIVSDNEEHVDLDGVFELSDTDTLLALGLDFPTLFSGVDLDALAPDGDGLVLVDRAHHTTVLEAIEVNLRSAFTLTLDVDGDGRIDDEDPVLLRTEPEDD